MVLDCMTGMDAKNSQIWQVLHIHMKNSKMAKKSGMVLIIGTDVGALTTWSVRISKYSH